MTQTGISVQETVIVDIPGMGHNMAIWVVVGEASDMASHVDLILQFYQVSIYVGRMRMVSVGDNSTQIYICHGSKKVSIRHLHF